MQDTKPEVSQKQHEIFFRLPAQERMKQAIDMVEFGLSIVENSIKAKHKDISEKDLKIEKIKRLYKNDFTESKLQMIIAHFEKL